MNMILKEKQFHVESIFGYSGRMLSGSKSGYSAMHPKSKVFFNGNIYDAFGNKLWYGDVDITLDETKLKALAKELNEHIFVTAEHPFRWENPTPEKQIGRAHV